MMNLKKIKTKSGEILVESIIALSVLTIGFLSFIGLLNSSIGLSKVVTDNYVATYLAAEGIEIVRNIIDTNRLTPGASWNQGVDRDGSYRVEYTSSSLLENNNEPLKFNSQNNTYNYQNGANTPFRRTIIIENSTDRIKITSIVTWKGRGDSLNEVRLEDYVYNSL